MSQRPLFCLFLVLLAVAVACSGCTSQQNVQPAPVTTPAAEPPALTTPAIPSAAVPETPAAVTTEKTPAETEKVILETKGLISTTEYKTFDFRSMGDQFSQAGEKYRITIRADQPVIGYAVTRSQSNQLSGSQLVPHFVSSSEKIQWGLINPYMVLGKVTDETKTFTVETVNAFVYVVDARWMESDATYKTLAPFNYELTITKITSPEKS